MGRKTLFVAALAAALSAQPTISTAKADLGDLPLEERQVLLDMMLIGFVVETVRDAGDEYPDSGGGLVRLDSLPELHSPPYEDRFQKKDAWGHRYLYWSDGVRFAVLSSGPDGRLDCDYLDTEITGWADTRGDDMVVSDRGWLKRPMTQRERQERTMADIRSMGTAIEEYSIDNNEYPSAWGVEELEGHVAPHYIRALPRRDGWGNEFIVYSTPEGYEIRSTGRDGLVDESEPGGKTGTYDSDIVFSNGSFVQWPEGDQR
jgi:type II secretory pathway pseudopilin PulG